MTPEAAEEAARLLLAARRDRRAIPALPDHCRPSSVAEGYRVQAAFVAGSDDVAAGYKIGATSAKAQEALGVDGPFSGRILRGRLFNSPAVVLGDAFAFRLLEPEFAFRLGREPVPGSGGFAPEDLADAVASVHPSFEVVTSALDNWMSQGAASLIADNGVHGALVLGPGTGDWRDLDLAAQEVVLSVNGVERSRGRGANAFGGPLIALTWLANHLAEHGQALEAGAIVSTGVVTEFLELQAGDEAAADYGPLGRIELQIR